MSSYSSEKALVEDFLDYLTESSPWGSVTTASEFSYLTGRTDVIAVDLNGTVIAFEAKLIKWRKALEQAYKNTCFADKSYVVLPKKTALLAEKRSADFARRRVGICYLEKGKVVVLQEAGVSSPLQPWLWRKAKLMAERSVAEEPDCQAI